MQPWAGNKMLFSSPEEITLGGGGGINKIKISLSVELIYYMEEVF